MQAILSKHTHHANMYFRTSLLQLPPQFLLIFMCAPIRWNSCTRCTPPPTVQPFMREVDTRTVTSTTLPTTCPPSRLTLAATRCNWDMRRITYVAPLHRAIYNAMFCTKLDGTQTASHLIYGCNTLSMQTAFADQEYVTSPFRSRANYIC